LIFCGDTPRKSRDCSRLTAVLLLIAASHSKFGLGAGRTIAQFYYSTWTIEDGAPERSEKARANLGRLSVDSDVRGLFHFDGVRFQRYQPERGAPFVSQDIYSLLATPDGGLWVGFNPEGASFLKNGMAHSYGGKEGLPSANLTEFALDREGPIWARTTRGLLRFTNSLWEKIGTEWLYSAEEAAEETRCLFVDNQGERRYRPLLSIARRARISDAKTSLSLARAPDAGRRPLVFRSRQGDTSATGGIPDSPSSSTFPKYFLISQRGRRAAALDTSVLGRSDPLGLG
jgi:hypothetical protein